MSKMVMALLAAAAVLVLIAGCGGGSDSNSGTEATTSSLTKADFSKKTRPSQAQLEEAAEEVLIPNIRQEIDGIRALGAPSGEEAEVEAVLAAAEKGLEKGEENPGAMIEEGEGPFKKANELAREYGLVKCGEEEGQQG